MHKLIIVLLLLTFTGYLLHNLPMTVACGALAAFLSLMEKPHKGHF